MKEPSDYEIYRGRCLEFCEAALADDSTLTLVRGRYLCPIWGMQFHWWTVRQDGSVFDPTARQFPSKGVGEYIPFDGMVTCAQCGKELLEEDADIEGNYCFCSMACHMRFVGLEEFI